MTYVEQTEKMIDLLSKGGKSALEAYRDLFMARAEMSAREIIGCNDDNLLHALRGQISICFEQADAANSALETKDGEAKPFAVEGLP